MTLVHNSDERFGYNNKYMTEPYKRDDKGRLLPGHAGGPGRPKGKTMKEFAREFLLKMSDEEKVNLQQYITRIYGSLTTFNVFFRRNEDQFSGERGK